MGHGFLPSFTPLVGEFAYARSRVNVSALWEVFMDVSTLLNRWLLHFIPVEVPGFHQIRMEISTKFPQNIVKSPDFHINAVYLGKIGF